MACCLEVITWTNVDLSAVRSNHNHQSVISKNSSITKNSLKITYLTFHSNLPQACDLIHICGYESSPELFEFVYVVFCREGHELWILLCMFPGFYKNFCSTSDGKSRRINESSNRSINQSYNWSIIHPLKHYIIIFCQFKNIRPVLLTWVNLNPSMNYIHQAKGRQAII